MKPDTIWVIGAVVVFILILVILFVVTTKRRHKRTRKVSHMQDDCGFHGGMAGGNCPGSIQQTFGGPEL